MPFTSRRRAPCPICGGRFDWCRDRRRRASARAFAWRTYLSRDDEANRPCPPERWAHTTESEVGQAGRVSGAASSGAALSGAALSGA
eukprot:4237049-Prymnesium_polylepis.1